MMWLMTTTMTAKISMRSAAALMAPARFLTRVKKQDLLRYGGGLMARGLEVVGKFGLYALVAKKLGGYDSGLFFLCLTWANLTSTIARLGLERATIRHIASEIAVGQGLAARRVAVNSLLIVSATSLALGLLTVLAAPIAAPVLFHNSALRWPLMLAGAIIPAQTICWATSYILIGLKRTMSAQLILSALPPCLSLLALLAGLNDANLLLVTYALSYVACGAIGVAMIGLDWRSKLRDRPTPPDCGALEALPPLWKEARPFFVVEMTQTIVLNLPTLVLGHFAPLLAVGEFNIASRLSNLVNTVILSISLITAPNFAEHHRLGQSDALWKTDRNARRLILALTLPIVAAMLIFPSPLLRLLGSEFGAAWPVLIVLAFGQLVNCLLPFQDTLLAMTGHGRILWRLNIAQLCFGVIAGLLLIPPFGAIGAAITTALTLSVYLIGCQYAARRLVR
jgi:O-antigen/teichoic acid export membrane protein